MRRKPLSRSRRRLLGSALGLAPAATLGLLGGEPAAAAAGRVDPGSASAKALGYAPDGSATDRTSPEQRCGACLHFAGGEAQWGPCTIFQGAEVSAAGWCRAFSAR